MMKKILLPILFFTALTANARGINHYSSYTEELKFGLHLKSIIPYNKIGAFVEYKMHEAFGLQSGLLYFMDGYIMEEGSGKNVYTLVKPTYLSVPLLFRIYPGDDRQFCFFAGLQTSYLIRGDYLTFDISGPSERITEKVLEFFKKLFDENETWSELKDIKSDNLNNWAFHFVWGLDYEFSGGFQLGTEIGHGLTTLDDRFKETYFNWTAKFVLGYNFAKLL